MSRKIILYIATSLDGYIATEDDNLQWLTETAGEGDAGYSEMYASIDTMIMGKRTYDYVVEHTETFPHTDRKCYVFTSSEQAVNEDVYYVNEDVVRFTEELKSQPGSNIWIVGGSVLLDAYMKANLIDEYIITIAPHILGRGVPLFLPNNPAIELELIELKQFGQFAQMHYKVKR